jgi:lipopolysaccharide export system permease protein
MKRLHLMMVRAYLGPLVITFLVVLFLLDMLFLWKYVDDLMGKGIAWYVLVELLFYASASSVPLAMPLAVLFSSIMTMGGLGERSELVPLRSAGLGLFRILAPLIVFAMGLSAFTFYFSNNLLPMANLEFQSLLWDVTQKKPALNIRPGIFYDGIDGISIRVRTKNDETGELGDVLIYDHREPFQGNRTVVRAESGTMRRSVDGRHLVLTLRNGHFYDEHGGTGRNTRGGMTRGTFVEDEVRLDLSGLGLRRTDQELFKDHYKMLTMGQLVRGVDSLRLKNAERFGEQERHLANSLFVLRDTMRQLADKVVPMAEFERRLGPEEWRNLHEVARNMVRNHINYIDASLLERRGRIEQVSRFRIEAHRKPMMAFTCLVFFFIGAPLGAIVRRGGIGLPSVFAIVFFLLFHMISFSSEKLVVAGEMGAWPGMWTSTLVLLPIGVWLTWKAATDSPLLELDAYYRAWERLRERFAH